MKILAISISILVLSGCASHLVVYDKDDNKKGGVPVRHPLFVDVTTTTSFEVRPKYKGNEKEKLCSISIVEKSKKVLPVGDIYYVGFDPAPFGKSEFVLTFSEKGVLTKVSLNSDPTEAVKQATEQVATILPYLAAPKPILEQEENATRETQAVGVGITFDNKKTATDGPPTIPGDKERALYCLKKSVSEKWELPRKSKKNSAE